MARWTRATLALALAESFPLIEASDASASADIRSPDLSARTDLRMRDSVSLPQLSVYADSIDPASSSMPNPISILTVSRYSSAPAHSLSRYARTATMVSVSSPAIWRTSIMSSMVLGDVWSHLDSSSSARLWSPALMHASAISRRRYGGASGRRREYIILAECQSRSSTDILAEASRKSLSPFL